MERCYGYDDIIQNIKNIINEKGMKQGVVAERAGFTPQEFSNILNDRRKLLRVEYLLPIADALDVDVNSLYGVEKKEVSEMGNKTMEQAVEEFNENETSFVKSEALKLFCTTDNEQIALEALAILAKMAQPF